MLKQSDFGKSLTYELTLCDEKLSWKLDKFFLFIPVKNVNFDGGVYPTRLPADLLYFIVAQTDFFAI